VVVTARQRGEFLRTYVRMLLDEGMSEAEGFRHHAPGQSQDPSRHAPARGRDRWVINKVRALCAWYSKGLDGGSLLRGRINTADSLASLDEIIDEFFDAEPAHAASMVG
jgi:tRNA-dihydrouridine synthase